MNTVVRKKALSMLLSLTLVTSTFSGMFNVSASAASAQRTDSDSGNPIIQNIYTADPAPMVYNGTVYLYVDHDEDDASDPSVNFYDMRDWRCYSSTDMVNWTDHGVVMSLKTFSWAKSNAWAGQVIERDNKDGQHKFYYYCPVTTTSGGSAIGVGVADSPTGPFTDAIGGPLVSAGGDIDPTVYQDDDGQVYLYWGNPTLRCVKLNDDMISYNQNFNTPGSDYTFTKPGVMQFNMTHAEFGTSSHDATQTRYTEGPWFYRRGNLYYMVYAANQIPEDIEYSTSSNPLGPWKYQGVIMPTQGGSFTNHIGICDFKGNSYFFYHNGALPGGGGYDRSVCVEKFNYNEDGTIPEFNMTTKGVEPVDSQNPYVRIEAETYAWESSIDPKVAASKQFGIETEPCSHGQGNLDITSINNGDYIRIDNVDFKDSGVGTFSANVACGVSEKGEMMGGTIEMHLDSIDGPVVATLPVSYTGGWQSWRTKTVQATQGDVKGCHNIFMVFKGNSSDNLFNMDSWQCTPKGETKDLVSINATIDYPKIYTVSGQNKANLKVTALYADGTSADVTSQAVVTTDGNIASVSNGVITGLNPGTASINVKLNDKTAVADILVKDPASEKTVKSLTVSNPTITAGVGGTIPVTVTAKFADDHIEDVTNQATFTVKDANMADVSAAAITIKAPGSTTITVSYKDSLGNTATAQISLTATTVNAYKRVEAENFNQKSGNCNSENCSDAADPTGGKDVGSTSNGDWLEYQGVDFGSGSGATKFEVREASQWAAGTISVCLDNPNSTPIGTVNTTSTGDWQTYKTWTCPISGITGLHNVYLKIGGGNINLNWWKFDSTDGLNPYIRNEAEDYSQQSGTTVGPCDDSDDPKGGQDVGYIDAKDWIEFDNVGFGTTGAAKFEARTAGMYGGGKIEIHLDSLDGPLAGTVTAPDTGDWQKYLTVSCDVQGATGTHKLYLYFPSGNFNLNWWQFDQAPALTSISVTPPTKTSYVVGDKLDTTGLAVTAKYGDGSSKPVSAGYTLTGFDSSTAGTKTIAVTYQGKAATFTVTVKEKTTPVTVDKSALQALYNTCNTITKGNYTNASWTAFTTAFTNAKAVLANGNAIQNDVNNAVAALTAARNGLVQNSSGGSSGNGGSHHNSGGSSVTPTTNPTTATISGSTITTSNGTFVTDTTTDVRVAGSYTAKLTSSNGQAPKVVIGTPGVFDVQISTTNGKDYFVKLIPISQTAGVQAGVYIDGVKVFVATVGTPAAPSVKSDTTRPFSVRSGASYIIKLTAGSRPTLVVGSAGAFKVEFVKSSGNEYFFRIVPTGKKGSSTGLYVNSGKAPISVATVA